MKIADIVKGVNTFLDGELLTESQLLTYLDDVIDDINESLASLYPTFTENKTLPGYNGSYDHFPDRYLRGVVQVGAAYKYYTSEEEGENIASDYDQKYQKALFIMKRDYLEQVPTIYQATYGGILDVGWESRMQVQTEQAAFNALFPQED